VSPEAVARYVAGFPLYSGTLQKFAAYLREVSP
jgi:hypothetical protein